MGLPLGSDHSLPGSGGDGPVMAQTGPRPFSPPDYFEISPDRVRGQKRLIPEGRFHRRGDRAGMRDRSPGLRSGRRFGFSGEAHFEHRPSSARRATRSTTHVGTNRPVTPLLPSRERLRTPFLRKGGSPEHARPARARSSHSGRTAPPQPPERSTNVQHFRAIRGRVGETATHRGNRRVASADIPNPNP